MEKEFDPDDFWLTDKRNDKDKNVLISSNGGLLRNEKGTVIYGPFQNEYEIKDGMRSIYKISKPNWCVWVPRLEKHLYFVESELRFV
jgi:hypothetical protein